MNAQIETLLLGKLVAAMPAESICIYCESWSMKHNGKRCKPETQWNVYTDQRGHFPKFDTPEEAVKHALDSVANADGELERQAKALEDQAQALRQRAMQKGGAS